MNMVDWLMELEKRDHRLNYDIMFERAQRSGACEKCISDCWGRSLSWNNYTEFPRRAAKNGHVDCLKKLHLAECCVEDFVSIFITDLECLKYLHDIGCCCEAVIHHAAFRGDTVLIDWGFKHLSYFDEGLTAIAAQQGNLKLLQHLFEHRCRWDYNTLQCAARRGHLHCLEYAWANGCVPNHLVIYYAALENQPAMVKWAMERKFPWSWTVDTCKQTIKVYVKMIIDRVIIANHANVIKTHWLECYYNPRYSVCRRRLLRESSAMLNTISNL